MIRKVIISTLLAFFVSTSFGASREWLDATRPTNIYQNLNGEWSYHDMADRPYFQTPLPSDGWQTCKVPVGNPMPSECVYRWWKKEFSLSDDLKKACSKGDRAILYLGGRSNRWQIRLNGKELFDSIDPLNPFDVDITDSLNVNGKNTLVIGTTDRLAICKDLDPRAFIVPKPDNAARTNSIWGDVELRMRPQNRIEDIFVKCSWRKKQLEIDVEAVNAAKDWKVGGEVFNQNGKIVLEIPFSSLSGVKNGLTLFTLSQKWSDPIPWNVDKPYLYTLELFLKDPDGIILDRREVEFGFRELWIEGPNLMMNGRRLFLARKTIWPFTPTSKQIKVLAEKYSNNPGINTLRINRGAYYQLGEFAWYADRLGLMLQPQQICAPTSYEMFKPTFWDNYFKFIKRWIKEERNHPSIVMWALSNEALWCLYQKDTEHYISKKLSEAADIASEVDPTRVSQFDGDWDLPPEGKNPVANLHYPFDPITNCYPTECWKFLNPKEPFRVRGLTGRYNWIGDKFKPIIVGEFIWMWSSGNRPRSDAMYGGDRVFDWEFWRKRKIFNQNLRWFTDVWRVARYAGVNPWSHSRSDFRFLIPLETIILRDQFRTFFSGEELDLAAWALNDTPVDHSYTIEWSILRGKEKLFTQSENLEILAGEMTAFKMHLKMPELKKAEDLNLKVEIFRGKREKRFSELWPIRVHPKTRLTWPADTVLFDPIGDTKELFTKLGLKPVSVESLEQLDGKKGVVIGKNALAEISENDVEKTIPKFVEKGGDVFCLSQSEWPKNFAFASIHAPEKTRANFAWIRSLGHPAFKDLKNIDLGLWRPGDWVCDNSLEKPKFFTGVPWRPLLDTGNFLGLVNAPLLEVFPGKGRFTLCSMNLSKAEKDPGARRLLANLLNDMTKATPKRSSLAFSGDENSELYKFLIASGMLRKDKEKDSNARVMLIDASEKDMSPKNTAKRVQAGATVWLNNLTPENIKAWSEVVPGGLELKKAEIKESCLIYYDNFNPLLRGISNQEFFWAGGTWTEAFRRLRESETDIHGVYPIVKIAEYQIFAPNGKALLKPSVMLEVVDQKGRWLLSTIDFEAGLRQMPTAMHWFFQNVLNNLNLEFKAGKIRKIDNFHMIDLKKFANLGFQDDVKGDGKGGCWDFGPVFDYRFFPVNLSGVNDIGEPDPAPTLEKFPSIMKFEGIPFKIIDPRSNNGKSMIVMEPRPKLLPESGKHVYLRKVTIPLDQAFDRFYVLQSAGWSVPAPGRMWSYILNYEDGGKAELAVRSGFEVGDWYKGRPVNRAHVAWRGKCLQGTDIGIYICPFENPHPSKKVKNIEIVSDLKSFGAIFAITLADFEKED